MPLEHDQRLNEIALKLVRADEQLNVIKTNIEEWRQASPYRLTKDVDAEGVGRYVWTYFLERQQPVPLGWSLLIGEFLYTVHSSLDHVAWLLAAQHSFPAAPDRVTFPIFKNRSQFWRKGRDGTYRQGSGGWALDRMPPAAGTLVDELQPYHRGDTAIQHPLWWLHELSNVDKHKTLHLVASAVVDQRVETVRLEHAEIVSFEVASGPLHERTEVGRLRARRTNEPGVGANPEIEVNVRFQVEEVFGDDTPVANVPVYDALTQLYGYVRNEVWLNRFAGYFNV